MPCRSRLLDVNSCGVWARWALQAGLEARSLPLFVRPCKTDLRPMKPRTKRASRIVVAVGKPRVANNKKRQVSGE
jgi:hypothetical protein